MHRVIWDIECNGILLTDKSDKSKNIQPPRPIFFEELDLLGLDKWWNYPKSESPLLWAVERNYFYRGEKVVEIKGGNIYDKPQILFTNGRKRLDLAPINIEAVVEKNKDAIFILENEAMDFIEHTFKTYRAKQNKVDMFVASFSGGKDSQVILDLVSRIIPPDDYIVTFTDTGMEIPPTHQNFRKTIFTKSRNYLILFYTMNKMLKNTLKSLMFLILGKYIRVLKIWLSNPKIKITIHIGPF